LVLVDSLQYILVELPLTPPSPSNPLKRLAPSFYKDREEQPRPGKKARTLSDMSSHFRELEHGYKVPPQRKRIEFSRAKRSKLKVLLFLECHRVLKDKGDKPSPPVRQLPAARKYYEERLKWWQKEEYIRPSQSQASPVMDINK
jgi:hypothetical protein